MAVPFRANKRPGDHHAMGTAARPPGLWNRREGRAWCRGDVSRERPPGSIQAPLLFEFTVTENWRDSEFRIRGEIFHVSCLKHSQDPCVSLHSNFSTHTFCSAFLGLQLHHKDKFVSC